MNEAYYKNLYANLPKNGQGEYKKMSLAIDRIVKQHPEYRGFYTEFMQTWLVETSNNLNQVKGLPPREAQKKFDLLNEQSRKKFVDSHPSDKKPMDLLYNEMNSSIFTNIGRNFYDKGNGGMQWGGVAGGLLGLLAGMMFGGGIGSWIGILAMIAGAVVGGWLGDMAGDKIQEGYNQVPDKPKKKEGTEQAQKPSKDQPSLTLDIPDDKLNAMKQFLNTVDISVVTQTGNSVLLKATGDISKLSGDIGKLVEEAKKNGKEVDFHYLAEGEIQGKDLLIHKLTVNVREGDEKRVIDLPLNSPQRISNIVGSDNKVDIKRLNQEFDKLTNVLNNVDNKIVLAIMNKMKDHDLNEVVAHLSAEEQQKVIEAYKKAEAAQAKGAESRPSGESPPPPKPLETPAPPPSLSPEEQRKAAQAAINAAMYFTTGISLPDASQVQAASATAPKPSEQGKGNAK